MKTDRRLRCDFCANKAVAYQHGSRVCGACGIQRTLNSPEPGRRSRRMTMIGVLSSGMLVRLMIGSIAVAAVGGWAASTSPRSDAVPSSSTLISVESIAETTGSTMSPEPVQEDVDDLVSNARAQADNAQGLADASKAWANCVSKWAKIHSGDQFDPREVCGDRPDPSDYGIGEPASEDHSTRAERRVKGGQPENSSNGKAPSPGNGNGNGNRQLSDDPASDD